MEERKNSETTSKSSQTALTLGIVVFVAIVVAGVILRPKTFQTVTPVPIPIPTPGPITGLGCENQYYNTKIGFAEYYLSVEGVDVAPAKEVTCNFSAKVGDKVVGKATVKSPLTDSPARSGATFRCTTQALALNPSVATVIDVGLKDDTDATASCSAAFSFPAP